MEADEIHGVDNVAAAQVDDFTVETSLEDLEFGFSVIKSTQKVLVYLRSAGWEGALGRGRKKM